MGMEYEKKFLLLEDSNRYATAAFENSICALDTVRKQVIASGAIIAQGYLPLAAGLEVAKDLLLEYDFEPTEVRIRHKAPFGQANEHYFTMKGKGGSGRPEIEQSIGVLRFKDLWEQTQGSRIYKKRMNVERNGLTIEIDDYIHRDLMVAEVEVPREELLVTIPIYGRDVTEDKNYKNRNLAR